MSAPRQALQRSASALESFNDRAGAALQRLFRRKGAVDEIVDEERNAAMQRLVQWVRLTRRGGPRGRPVRTDTAPETAQIRTLQAVCEAVECHPTAPALASWRTIVPGWARVSRSDVALASRPVARPPVR